MTDTTTTTTTPPADASALDSRPPVFEVPPWLNVDSLAGTNWQTISLGAYEEARVVAEAVHRYRTVVADRVQQLRDGIEQATTGAPEGAYDVVEEVIGLRAADALISFAQGSLSAVNGGDTTESYFSELTARFAPDLAAAERERDAAVAAMREAGEPDAARVALMSGFGYRTWRARIERLVEGRV